MSFLEGEARDRVLAAPPGLQLVTWLGHSASSVSESGRTLLSFWVSALVTRGWLSPVEKLLDAAVEAVGEDRARIEAACQELSAAGLVQIEDGRVTTLAATLSTRPTSISYFLEDDHKVHLLGPIAALAIPVGLGRPGEVLADCPASEPKRRLRLVCDADGVHTRDPESICLFLPAWDGEQHPAEAMRGGALLADDDALAAWQEKGGDPEGMPLPSMMFPMAATDLGRQAGKALESLLDRFAAFA